jgi:hypothetical protein
MSSSAGGGATLAHASRLGLVYGPDVYISTEERAEEKRHEPARQEPDCERTFLHRPAPSDCATPSSSPELVISPIVCATIRPRASRK